LQDPTKFSPNWDFVLKMCHLATLLGWKNLKGVCHGNLQINVSAAKKVFKTEVLFFIVA
jgi:hypothetical protein